jgi:hypothetical protein
MAIFMTAMVVAEQSETWLSIGRALMHPFI